MLLCFGERVACAEGNEATKVILPCGVRLILKPEPASEFLAITAFVAMPQETTAQEEAIGEMVARALFYGSQNRSYESVVDSVRQVGGSLETVRTGEYVALVCLTTPEQLRETAYLFSEALKNADFSPEALRRGYKDLIEERRKLEKEPFRRAQALLSERMRSRPAAELELAQRVTQTQAQSYFQSRYVPSRTVVSIVGRFSPEAAQRTFDANMNDFERQPSRYPPFPPAPPSHRAIVPVERLPATGNTSYALIAAAAPSVTSADYPAFVVLNTLLGGGHASRLFRRVRDVGGFGYEVGSILPADRGSPMITFLQWDARRMQKSSAPASSAMVPDEALKQLNRQLDDLKQEPPAEEEVERARQLAIGKELLRHERARDRSFLLGWYEAMGMGYGYDAELPRRLGAVTRADVLRLVATYTGLRAAVLVAPTGR